MEWTLCERLTNLALGIRSHVLRRHQTNIVTKCPEPTTEVMCPDTGLQTDQTRQHIGEPGLNAAARPLLPQNNLSAAVLTNNVERVPILMTATRALIC
jgi:hypothetical protein